ncbi:MAG: MFS transporter [Promethearchaeota archaeon]
MKNLKKIRKRNLYACFTISLMYGFGEGGFFVILQPLLLEITGLLFSVGVIMTIVSLVQVILMPLIGKLMDRFGRKKLWLVASPIIIFGCILLIVAMSVILAGVAVILIYIGGVIHTMSSLMIVSENSEDSKKGSNFSFRFFGGSGASILGFMLVLFNVSSDYKFYIWLFIVMNVFLWLVVFFALSPIKSDYIKERNSSNPIKENKMAKLFQNPKIRKIVIFFTLNWFFYGVTITIWNAWFVDTYGVSGRALALFFIIVNTFRMIFQIPAGHIIDKIGKRKALIISLISCIYSSICSLIVFFTWSSGFTSILIPGYVFSVIFFAIYITLIIPVESMYFTNLTENGKAESFGTVKLITDGALIPTGVVGGSLADFVHPIAPEIVHFGGFMVLLWFPVRYFNDRKNQGVDESVIH